MSKHSRSLPQGRFVVKMQHKYAVGDVVVCVRDRHDYRGHYGKITEQFPFTFNFPGYRVQFGDKIVAMSEVSLRRVGILSRIRFSCVPVVREWLSTIKSSRKDV